MNPFKKRPPDFIIGTSESPYMLRWWILPRNRWFNIYLHKIVRDDDDRALHDHPWPSLSWIISGQLMEQVPNKRRLLKRSLLPVYRHPTFRHRLELVNNEPAKTIFVTGPKVRNWGFWCSGDRFVPWQEFVDPVDVGKAGRGCGEES